jgi:hypothetical protein
MTATTLVASITSSALDPFVPIATLRRDNMKITVSHEFAGWGDYWRGNGRRWDDNAGCLFAYYNGKTTLKECVDQWVEEFWSGGDCDSLPAEVTGNDLREAILTTLLNERGRADYESGALCEFAENIKDIVAEECAEILDDDADSDDLVEWPVWIILVEVETCPDCGACSGEETYDELCDECQEKHHGNEYIV